MAARIIFKYQIAESKNKKFVILHNIEQLVLSSLSKAYNQTHGLSKINLLDILGQFDTM